MSAGSTGSALQVSFWRCCWSRTACCKPGCFTYSKHWAGRPRLRGIATANVSDCSARSWSHSTTPSSQNLLTARSPAGTRPRNTCSDFTAAAAVGNSIDLIVPADRTTEMHDILSRIGQGERIEHHETVRTRKDGSPVDVSLSISPIKSASGEIVGASKTVRDITESKRTQRALGQQIEDRRGMFEN